MKQAKKLVAEHEIYMSAGTLVPVPWTCFDLGGSRRFGPPLHGQQKEAGCKKETGRQKLADRAICPPVFLLPVPFLSASLLASHDLAAS